MKVFGLVFLCIVTISGLPATSRSPAEPDDCSKECLNGVNHYGQELSILKHSDLSNYFNKIDEVCEVITTVRKCLDKCGVTSNPFALESLNIVCQPKIQEKISIIKQCLHYVDSNVNEICSKECSSDRIIDEADTAKMDPIVQTANKNCANFKCMARCNIEVAAEQCGKDIGTEFENLLQQVVDTQRKDLEFLNLVETMAKTSPPECNYLYDPSVLFGEKQSEESSTPAPADPKEDAKSIYAQAQLQLLLKQLELTEKQDQLVDRENAKLDMEMAFIAHKAEQRERKFRALQHALPTFVPMEKMPKEPLTMEPLHPPMEDNHPEQTPSHPQMEESQPQSNRPEQMPMNFPHPMPLETIFEQPNQHKMPKQPIGPVFINGVPMEFVPMGEMPMQNPREAMPRFI